MAVPITPQRAREALADLVHGSPQPFPLDEAALLLAVDAYPELDFDACRRGLDDLAAQVNELAGPDPGPMERVAALRRGIFEAGGFQGDRDHYYDAQNSYLNRVLQRRRGIPITLSIVVMAVGSRLRWPLSGVNFPYHFLVTTPNGAAPLAIDPFAGGLVVAEQELRHRWRQAELPETPLRQMLAAAEPRRIILRVLNNLKVIHTGRQEYELAVEPVEKMMLLEPEEPGHLRDLGYLLTRGKHHAEAIQQFRRYLDQSPEAKDRQFIERLLMQLERQAARWN